MMLYVFTEDPSMKEVLKIVLPKLGVVQGSFKIIDFQGAGNLENSIERQIRAISNADARFLVLRDNDRGDCLALKRRLLDKVAGSGRLNKSKVRIVCQMLESWFIGDAAALTSSGHLRRPVPKRLTVCDPDMIDDPKKELTRLRGGYQEISGAKAIAPYLNIGSNRSPSFAQTISAIRQLTAA